MATTQQSINSLYLGIELSARRWKLAFGNGAKIRFRNVDLSSPRAFEEVEKEVALAKAKLGLDPDCEVRSCYEAGRDGFWIHRYLKSIGIRNVVVDASSIEVNRRARRAKTDLIDARKLVEMLIRYCEYGEKKIWKPVNVPSRTADDQRQPCRERKRLIGERTALTNRMKSAFVRHGAWVEDSLVRLDLDAVRDWNGDPLPAELCAQLKRDQERLHLISSQLKFIEQQRRERVANPDSKLYEQAAQLLKLKGVGAVSSCLLASELFAWRNFRNRRQVGGCVGLTGSPYDSGKSRREQGISKAGNAMVRTSCVELAWCWIRYQPGSKITQWFVDYVGKGDGGKGTRRLRRVAIVAVARKLLVALWKYLDRGEVPEGAVFSV